MQLLDLLAGVILQYWLTLVYLQEGVGDQRQEGARCEAPTDDGKDDGLVMIWAGQDHQPDHLMGLVIFKCVHCNVYLAACV